MKILFAEDDPSIRDIISIFLRGTSHHFEFAINGGDALDKLKSGVLYDIVFIDQSMPLKNGNEVVKEFRIWEAQNQQLKTIVLAMTAFQDEFTLKSLMDSGCDDVVVKPVSKKVLLDILVKLSHQKAA